MEIGGVPDPPRFEQAHRSFQVAFRLDFPSWLGTLSQRNRALVEDMALGEKTQKLAQKYQVTEGRISQMRRSFEQDWSQFCAGVCDAVPVQA